MAKIQGPFLGLGASGSIAKTLTVATWRGRAYVRQLVIPHNPETPAQLGVRAAFAFTVAAWKALTFAQKEEWTAAGKSDDITSLNAMQRRNQVQWAQELGPIRVPSDPAGAAPAAATVPAASVSGKYVTLTWVDSVTAEAFSNLVYISNTLGFTPAKNLIRGELKMATQKLSLGPLTPGTYYSRIKVGRRSGELSVATAEISFVIA